jgi:hypothetical protein
MSQTSLLVFIRAIAATAANDRQAHPETQFRWEQLSTPAVLQRHMNVPEIQDE